MKYFVSVIKRWFPKKVVKPVGRWGVEECNTKTNYKIDYSNEDHCGPCGQYVMIKQDELKTKSKDTDNR
uniref:Uncharacterized protein n=1 Tax=viral metagenome TaxID=1070528 RepID=A0A6C0I573_9ZZZZ